MKRIHIISIVFFFIAVAVTSVSCYKDKGNYDYTAVNKITITDPRSATTISIKQGETLVLNPTIKQTLEADESNLTYQWSEYENNPGVTLAAAEIVLDSSRQLNRIIASPPFTLGLEYKIIFRATDKKTGVASFLIYTIKIDNEFTEGWMFLEEKGSSGDLSMILPSGKVVNNVYSDRNKNTPLGKPVKLEATTYAVTDDISTSGKKIYILHDNGGLELDYQTMVKKFDYNFLFFAPPPVIKPQYMNWAASSTVTSASLGIVINNGLVHSNLVGGFPGSKKWGERLVSTSGDLNYQVAPYVAGGTTYVAVVYDNTNKRFAHVPASIGATATALNAFPSTASDPAIFDMNNVGMTMLFMDSANVVRDYNAIMKDNNNIPYLLRFKTVSTTGAPVVTLQKTAMNAPGILNMTSAAGSTNTPHIYYAVNNQLSRYETTSNSTISAYSFGAGENITKMETFGPRLVIATWNGAVGKVYFFTISPTGAITLANSVSGFAKIVDLTYKTP